MTPSHRPRFVLITIAITSVLCSCVSNHSQSQLMVSFLPAPVPTPKQAEPNPIPAGLYDGSMPVAARTTLASIEWPTEADGRILQADERFEAGKKLYQLGNIEGARAEFNRAVDVLLNASTDLPNRQKLERRLEQLVDSIYRYDLEGLGSGEKQEAVVYDKSPKDEILQMTFPIDPNLKPFFDRGGKLLMYHGWTDQQVTPMESTIYYDSVIKKVGKDVAAKGLALFMVPGMNHCQGGAGTDTFDKMGTIEAWVASKTAPTQIVASHRTLGAVDRTRPLCRYPQVAKYSGSGSTDEAANFSCVTP